MTAAASNRARRLAWVVALLALGVGGALIRLVAERRAETSRRAARDAAADFGRRLEQELNGCLSTAQVVAAILRETGRIDRFQGFAADLLRGKPSIESLQLAPDAVVSQVAPPEAVHGSLPRDLRQDPAIQPLAELAVATKAPVLAGPIGRAPRAPVLLGLHPVLVLREGGGERLWGFVAVAVGLRALLQNAGAEALLTAGYDYDLESTNPTSRRSVVLARSTEAVLTEPISVTVGVPASSWTLAVAPRAGWRSSSTVATEVVIVLVVALLAALSAHRLAREPETLMQEAEVRRNRLSEANRQLRIEVTQRLEAEERLRHDAAHDPLTSLPNRAAVTRQIQATLDVARERKELGIAVLLLDVDRFKYVNDSLGDTVGDRLLLAIAKRLQACLRPGDVIARLGGDEFAILLTDARELETVTGVAERLLREMKLPHELGEQQVFSTVSIGIALVTPACARAEDLLRDADTAMHRAKAQGRARYVCFDEGMRTRVVTLLQLETDLRRAIERDEFRVRYQPIVSLAEGRVSGCEALVRWQHPSRGLIDPGEFLPLAEETGLVIWIDRFVLGEAARQAREWQELFPRQPTLSVSVNFSGRQLAQPRLVEHVAEALEHAGLPASSLRIEITESVIMENADASLEVLRRLREMEVRLSIDDFGTGYSSLAYLDRFPFHTVKVDQSFVRGREDGARGLEIVRTIVDLARRLGMDVIAEGVETERQLGRLREAACGFAQGYLFSRPLDAAAMARLIESDPRW